MQMHNKGFSLIQILILSSVLAGISYVGMQMKKTHTRSSSNLISKIDEKEIKEQLLLALSDQQACTKTFAGKKIGDSLSVIKNASGEISHSVGSKYGESHLTLKGLKTVSKGSTNGNLISVVLNVEILKSSTGRNINNSFNIPLNLEINESLITGCITDTEEAELTKLSFCKSIAGTWKPLINFCEISTLVKKSGDSMTGTLTVPDLTLSNGSVNVLTGEIKLAANQKICTGNLCQNFSAKRCQANHYMAGINGDGSLICIPFPAP